MAGAAEAAKIALAFALALEGCAGAGQQTPAVDPLPSWNDGAAKLAIVGFVERVAEDGGLDFVPTPERIAVFDNDGTLWAEQPIYFQLAFALDQVKALAPQHPEWRDRQPFKAVIEGDPKALAAAGEKGLFEIMAATHTGVTIQEFSGIVADWLATARHPRFERPYTELAYQPMLELLAYLRAERFKTFIVSGGGIEFMRVFTERVYGIPPEQVVGSSGVVKFEMPPDGKPVLVKEAEVEFVDDGPGKPVGINRFIGRRPIMAFGNSNGDLQMLQRTTAGDGPRFGLIVHHTDAKREWAYDRDSHIGRLDNALDQANADGWTIVDIRRTGRRSSRRRRNERAAYEDARAGRGRNSCDGSAGGRATGSGSPAALWRPVGHHGRTVSLGDVDGRPRHRGRHQSGRRRPVQGRPQGFVVRRNDAGRRREGALRRRHQRPVRTGLVGHRCGPDRDRHNQRHRAARDRAVLSGGRLGVSHVVFRPAASASGRARGRVSLDLHAHRTRGSRRPRRGSERDLSTR